MVGQPFVYTNHGNLCFEWLQLAKGDATHKATEVKLKMWLLKKEKKWKYIKSKQKNIHRFMILHVFALVLIKYLIWMIFESLRFF